jgi:hypothetical protein
LVNSGIISGGSGASGGGVGVHLRSGTLANSGTITGGGGLTSTSGDGGPGGLGVDLGPATLPATLVNKGTISGGSGSNSVGGQYPGGNGGAGVYLNGGTLINANRIAGGAAGVGDGGGPTGAAGDAVQFGSGAAKLIVEPSAVFNGQVVANPTVADVLELAGTTTGRLGGLGTEFTNFHTVDVAKGAQWNLGGTDSLTGTSTLVVRSGADLFVTGSLEAEGTLALLGAGRVGGHGTIAIDPFSVLDAHCRLATEHLTFMAGGDETLILGRPATVRGTIAGFGASVGNSIDLLSRTATAISYTTLSSSSGVLSVTGTAGSIAALHFSGGNYQGRFHYSVVGGNTHITFG